jgi:hypothetical protein
MWLPTDGRGRAPRLAASLGALLLGLALRPGAALAQGFRAEPSLGVAELYDDNLFSTLTPVSDTITRVTPGLTLGWARPAFSLTGRYAFDAEYFRSHPELDDSQARRDATLGLQASSERVGLSVVASYLETQTPGELNLLSAFELGRLDARRLSTSETLNFRLGALATLALGHSFVRDELAFFPDNDTQVGSVALERRLTPRATGGLGYALRRFGFLSDQTRTTHVVTASWSHDLTPRTRLELKGGPRFGAGETAPELAASLRHRFARGDVGASYVLTEATVFGSLLPVESETISLSLNRQLLRSLRLSVAPARFRTRGEGFDARVHRIFSELGWRLARWLSLNGSHMVTFQRGSLENTLEDVEIVHNIFMLRLVASRQR